MHVLTPAEANEAKTEAGTEEGPCPPGQHALHQPQAARLGPMAQLAQRPQRGAQLAPTPGAAPCVHTPHHTLQPEMAGQHLRVVEGAAGGGHSRYTAVPVSRHMKISILSLVSLQLFGVVNGHLIYKSRNLKSML